MKVHFRSPGKTGMVGAIWNHSVMGYNLVNRNVVPYYDSDGSLPLNEWLVGNSDLFTDNGRSFSVVTKFQSRARGASYPHKNGCVYPFVTDISQWFSGNLDLSPLSYKTWNDADRGHHRIVGKITNYRFACREKCRALVRDMLAGLS